MKLIIKVILHKLTQEYDQMHYKSLFSAGSNSTCLDLAAMCQICQCVMDSCTSVFILVWLSFSVDTVLIRSSSSYNPHMKREDLFHMGVYACDVYEARSILQVLIN